MGALNGIIDEFEEGRIVGVEIAEDALEHVLTIDLGRFSAVVRLLDIGVQVILVWWQQVHGA
jgi:hypothetical protein